MADGLGDSRTSESLGISEHGHDQEIALNLKDHEIEVNVLKEGVNLPEEKPPVSDSPPDTQGIHVKNFNFCFAFWFDLDKFQNMK